MPSRKPLPDDNAIDDIRQSAGLRVRILAALGMVLAPILIFGVARTIVDYGDAVDRHQSQLLAVSDRTIDQAEKSLSEAEAILRIFSEYLRLGQCSAVAAEIGAEIPMISNVAFFSPDGIATCSSVGAPGYEVTDLEWLERAGASNETFRTRSFYGPISQSWIFALIHPEYEADEFRGFSAFAVRADMLVSAMSRIELPDDVEVALIDEEGRVIGSDRFLDDGEFFRREVLPGLSTTTSLRHESANEQYDIVVHALGGSNIYAIASRPVPSMWGTFLLLPTSSLIVPFVVFILALVVAWTSIDQLVLRWLTKLRQLSLAYGRGRYNFDAARAFEGAPVDFRDVAGSFSRMAERIERRDAELRDALAIRDAAVREIHHRVKNNLQIITSFLSLQARGLEDSEARQVLAAARHRIDALSIVHRTLYQNERLEKVAMKPFLSDLLAHLKSALGLEGTDGHAVELRWDIAEVERDADDAIPMALFLLEAVTNAVKYAFPDERSGVITVSLSVHGDTLHLAVTDNGHGAGAPTSTGGTGLGSRLMQAFARQLQATLKTDAPVTGGYRVRLTIPHASEDQLKDHQGDATGPNVGI